MSVVYAGWTPLGLWEDTGRFRVLLHKEGRLRYVDANVSKNTLYLFKRVLWNTVSEYLAPCEWLYRSMIFNTNGKYVFCVTWVLLWMLWKLYVPTFITVQITCSTIFQNLLELQLACQRDSCMFFFCHRLSVCMSSTKLSFLSVSNYKNRRI